MDRTDLIFNSFCDENDCLDTITINTDEPHILFLFETSSNMDSVKYTKPSETQNCDEDIPQSSMTTYLSLNPSTTKSIYPRPSFMNDSQTVFNTQIDIETVRNVFIVWVIIFITCCIFPTIIGILICVSLYKREEMIKNKELKLRHHFGINTEESVKDSDCNEDSDSNHSQRSGSDDSKVVIEMENELTINTTMNCEEEELTANNEHGDGSKGKNKVKDDDEDENKEESVNKNKIKSEPNLEEIQNMNLSITIGEVSHDGMDEDDGNNDLEKKDGDDKHLAPPPEVSHTQTMSSVVESLMVHPRYSQDLRSISLFKQMSDGLEAIHESSPKSEVSDNDNGDYKDNNESIQITRNYKIEIEPSQDDEFALYLNKIYSGDADESVQIHHKNMHSLSEMLKISRHNTPDFFEASKESKETDGMTDKLNVNRETLEKLGETGLYGFIEGKGKGCISIESILSDGMYEGGNNNDTGTTTTGGSDMDNVNDTVQSKRNIKK